MGSLEIASRQVDKEVATSASFPSAMFAADVLQRAAKTLTECRTAGTAPGMQSLARPGFSSLSWAGSSRHCASSSRQRTYGRRTPVPVSAYIVSQASQSPNSPASSSQDRKEAGRGASDTIRSLDSILGSTDDTEVEQSRADGYASASSSSVTAFSGSSAAVGLPSSRPQEEASREFQGATPSSRGGSTADAKQSIVQWGLDYAKGFIEDKIKRPSAEDLLVAEDIKLLPKLQPRVAYLILAINLGVYAAGLVSGFIDGADAQQDYFLALAKTDAGVEAGEYYRLITANFVHDSFVHLAGSSYALATVAPAIEEVLGWDIFLAVYLMSSLGGNVATFAFGDALTVGASSGIFGLIGALVAYLWRNRSLSKTSEQLNSIVGILIFNLVLGGIQDTSIDNIGHVAGLLVGSYLGAGLSPKMVSSVDQHTLEQSADEVEPVKLDVLHVSHKGALRRWAAYASFAATLSLLAAGTVVTRTGELPMPKGLDLLAF